MHSSKDVIEKIRRKRFGIGLSLEGTSDDVRECILDKEEVLDRAARLAKDINTQKPRLIFELVQNAEDNEYEDGVEPLLRFILRPDCLLVQNNEKGFREENVDAICLIGGTTKKRSLGYIGEKGIGFKSVFLVTTEPQIYSNGFHFRFVYKESDPTTMIIPEWVETPPDFIDLSQTNLVMPLGSMSVREEVLAFLKEIHPSLLLFLQKLRKIEIQDLIGNSFTEIRRREENERVIISTGEKEEHWKVIRKLLDVPSDLYEERRKDVTQTEIILAFPCKVDGTPEVTREQYVFSFLPVRKEGFRFIIQADFLLAINREDIIKHSSWNRWLRDSIAEAFARAVDHLKADKKLRLSFFQYLDFSDVKDEFFLKAVEQIFQHLQRWECALTESNQWRKPGEVLNASKEVRELISNNDAIRLFGKEYLSSKVLGKSSVFRELGILEVSARDLIKCLEQTEWLTKKSDEWFYKLFDYLSKQKLSDEEIEYLRNLKILKLQNGELASINEDPVFFPLDKKGKDYGFETELRIIRKNIYQMISRDKENAQRILGFLRDLGVQDSDSYQVIENHILPAYENDTWKEIDPGMLRGYIRYIKENIEKYEKEAEKRLNIDETSDEKRRDPLKRLKKAVRVEIGRPEQNVIEYDSPSNLYLPEVYGNQNKLEWLFEGLGARFISWSYIVDILTEARERIRKLEDSRKQKGTSKKKRFRKQAEKIDRQIRQVEEWKKKHIESWKDFFSKIGVHEGLKVTKANGEYLTWEQKSNLREKRAYSRGCTEEEITDYMIELLSGILDSADEAKLAYLFELLEKQWEELRRFIHLLYEWKYYTWYLAKTDSTWIHLLKSSKWVPIADGGLARPGEVFLDTENVRALLGDSVLYLGVKVDNEEFLKAIGVNTEANAEAVMNYLRVQVEQGSRDKEVFEQVYQFLDEHFEEEGEKIRKFFSEQPLIFIPDTTKRYFTASEVLWEDAREIFGENRGYLKAHYRKLKHFFVDGLGVAVKPSPEEYGRVLLELSSKQAVDERDRKIVLKIYEGLNSYLDPETADDDITQETWWEELIKGPIFLVKDGNFRRNYNNILINDAPELHERFCQNEEVQFLWLPEDYPPHRLKHFINAIGLRFLSDSVQKVPLVEEESCELHEELSKLINGVIPYVLRYLFWKENPSYENLKSKELFSRVKNVAVYAVNELPVRYTIQISENHHVSVMGNENCLLYEDRLYIARAFEGDLDYLAIELARLFGGIKGLEDFIISVIEKRAPERIERLMAAKGIQDLPGEEKESFQEAVQVLTEEETDVTTGDQPEEPHPPDREEVAASPGKEGRMALSEDPEVEISVTKGAVSRGERRGAVNGTEVVTKEVPDHIQDVPTSREKWAPQCSPSEARINIEDYGPDKWKPVEIGVGGSGPARSGEAGRGGGSSTVSRPEKKPDDLTEEEKKAIGRWGEKYVMAALRKEKSEQYPEGDVIETDCGFRIEKDGRLLVEVEWLNLEKDKGTGYDIRLMEEGTIHLIEVKSSKEDEKDWFDVSGSQWREMQGAGDRFWIYRVYSAGDPEKARLIKICDPAGLWREDKITGYPVRIHI